MVAVATLVGCSSLPGSATRTYQKEEAIPLDESHWRVVYDGGGKVQFHRDGILLQSQVPKFAKDTFAALVVSRHPTRGPEFRLRLRYRVERQLRKIENTAIDKVRPWEVFWLFWGYREGAVPRQKETNYFILKQNGVELGRAHEETEQTFLATANRPTLEMMKSTEVVIENSISGAHIFVDGMPALDFENRARVHSLYQENGSIGLYVEDARASVEGVWISYPESKTWDR